MGETGLILLDVDGVLTSLKHNHELFNKTNIRRHSYHEPLDWNCILNLINLLETTNTEVVLTSGWRRYEEGLRRIKQILSFFELDDRFVGITDYLVNQIKDYEILKYID